jgi:RsiW-degrading membrane proteinase PrsW (M82 family)
MDPEQRKTLQWLAEQHYEEQRSLRAAEDNLFNWSSSIFLAGFGALTGLRGLSDARWGLWWRLLIILGVLAILLAILLMAYLIHRKYEQHEVDVAQIVSQLNAAPSRPKVDNSEERLFFYVRWGALSLMGLVTLGLVWMLGSPI